MRRSAFHLASLVGACLLSVTVLAAAYQPRVPPRPGGDARAQRRELQRLQGTWALYGDEVGGEVFASGQGETLAFEGNRWWSYDAYGQLVSSGVIDIVGFGPEASHADFRVTQGQGRGGFFPALIHIDGDTLQYCRGPAGAPRPRELATWSERGIRNTIWTRVR